jgi:hypothetical protein
MSVNRPVVKPIKPVLGNTIKLLSKQFESYKINIDLDKLYNSCPFKK